MIRKTKYKVMAASFCATLAAWCVLFVLGFGELTDPIGPDLKQKAERVSADSTATG